MNHDNQAGGYSPREDLKDSQPASQGRHPEERPRGKPSKPSKASKTSNHTLSNIFKIANLGRKAATSASAKQDSAPTLSLLREARTLTHDWLLIADEEVTHLERLLNVPPQDEHVPRGLKDASTLSMVGLLVVLAWKVMCSTGSERKRRLRVLRELRMVLREFVKDADKEIRHLERIVGGKHKKKKGRHGKDDGQKPKLGVEQPQDQPHPESWPSQTQNYGQQGQAPPHSPQGSGQTGSQQPMPQQGGPAPWISSHQPGAGSYPNATSAPPPGRPYQQNGPPQAGSASGHDGPHPGPPGFTFRQSGNPQGGFVSGHNGQPQGPPFQQNNQPQGVYAPGQTGSPPSAPLPPNGQQPYWPSQTSATANGYPMPAPTPGYGSPVLENVHPAPQHNEWAQPPGAAQEYYNPQAQSSTAQAREVPGQVPCTDRSQRSEAAPQVPAHVNMAQSGTTPPHSRYVPSRQQTPAANVRGASRADGRSAVDVSYISARGTASPERPMQMPQPMRPMPDSAFRSPAQSERRGRSRASRPSRSSFGPAGDQHETGHSQNERLRTPAERHMGDYRASNVQSVAPSASPASHQAYRSPPPTWSGTVPIIGSRADSRASRGSTGHKAPSARSSSVNIGVFAGTATPASSYSRQGNQEPALPQEFAASQTGNPDRINGGAIPRPRSHQASRPATSRRAPSVQTVFRDQEPMPDQQPAEYAPSDVHEDYHMPRAERRRSAVNTPSEATHSTQRSRKSHGAPSDVYEDHSMPRADRRHSAANAPSEATDRTQRSRKSHRAPSAVNSRYTGHSSHRADSRVPTTGEEEAFSEVDMFADMKGPIRPRVCHHSGADADSLCNSVAFSCELMDDGETLDNNHVHTKEGCGFVPETD